MIPSTPAMTYEEDQTLNTDRTTSGLHLNHLPSAVAAKAASAAPPFLMALRHLEVRVEALHVQKQHQWFVGLRGVHTQPCLPTLQLAEVAVACPAVHLPLKAIILADTISKHSYDAFPSPFPRGSPAQQAESATKPGGNNKGAPGCSPPAHLLS